MFLPNANLISPTEYRGFNHQNNLGISFPKKNPGDSLIARIGFREHQQEHPINLMVKSKFPVKIFLQMNLLNRKVALGFNHQIQFGNQFGG